MAENLKLTSIELNGVLYLLGKSIYEELDMSLERFAELLGRDLYCPTLTAAPTSSTLTYTDTDGSINTFQVGQPCRWADGSDYRIAVCKNITASASSWYIFPASFITEEQLDSKQDKVLKFTNLTAGTWVSDSTYTDFPYRCDVTCSGVTASNYAEVVFALEQATSGSYAPLCETKTNVVSIWSASNTSITIPTILVTI